MKMLLSEHYWVYPWERQPLQRAAAVSPGFFKRPTRNLHTTPLYLLQHHSRSFNTPDGTTRCILETSRTLETREHGDTGAAVTSPALVLSVRNPLQASKSRKEIRNET